MPDVAGELSVFDCAGVADGSAAAIVVRAEDAHRYTDKPLYVKALSFVAGNGSGLIDPDYDYTYVPRDRAPAPHDAYAQAGITDPRQPARHGRGARLLHPHRAGAHGGPRVLRARHRRGRTSRPARFDLGGELPVNPDGGLKSFGHPVGASRPAHDVRGLAPAPRRGPRGPPRSPISGDRNLALTHNLGGYPGEMVSFVGIYGTELG